MGQGIQNWDNPRKIWDLLMFCWEKAPYDQHDMITLDLKAAYDLYFCYR